MGKLETDVKKQIRNTRIQKAIISIIGTVGVLSVAMLAPNVFKILPKSGFNKLKHNKKSIDNSRTRLIKNGILAYDKNGFLFLTKKGESKFKEIEAKEYKIIKPKKWDRKWRVLIFDIREKKRVLRNKIRYTLVSIGFIRLQNSVWVFPYDCEDLITLLKVDFKIGAEVLYMVVDKIENDTILKKNFGLM